MAEQFTEQAKNALLLAKRTSRYCKHGYVGTEHILLGLLKEVEGTASMVLSECGVEESKLMALIDRLITPSGGVAYDAQQGYTPRAEKVLQDSASEASACGSEKIGTEHILLALLKETDCVATRLMYTLGVNMQKLYGEIMVAMGEDDGESQDDYSQNKQPASSTPVLDQYSRDLTQLAMDNKLDPVIGREREIGRIIQILSRRTKNNPCLIGEPGVGKTAIAEGLAQRIVMDVVPETVRNKRVVVLDLSGMVAGSKYRGEFEERIKNVVREVSENKGILLFIDEIHTIIGAGGAEGALDASNILKPSLSRGEIQLIGATTIDEYRKHIEKDAALERRFQPVMVEEPTQDEAIEILKGLRSRYEAHHGVVITDEALRKAAQLSVRYINDRCLPDKAIDLIDEASSKVQISGYKGLDRIIGMEDRIMEIIREKETSIRGGDMTKAGELQKEQEALEKKTTAAMKRYDGSRKKKDLIVDENAIAEMVSEWTKIPVQRLAQGEQKQLAKLEKTLHKRVIGQDEAVTAVAKAIKRGRVGLKDPNRPIGSFLFLGPTGVGKTELSKALAEAVFGTEQAMIRVDMSEYMEKHSVSKLIGSPPGYVGYEEGGQLSEKVRRHPYSVILFDEIEKAHPDVFNILLQVLDDGHITDAQGRKIDFKQTCIIMTSNAGAQAIVEPKKLGFASEDDEQHDYDRMKSGVMDQVRKMFKPEFLNRIDEIIVFHTLGKNEVRQIVTLLLGHLIRRAKEQTGFTLHVDNAVRDYLADAGYDAKYGARPLKREIQTKIEDALAEQILAGKISEGDTVNALMSKKDIKFEVTH